MSSISPTSLSEPSFSYHASTSSTLATSSSASTSSSSLEATSASNLTELASQRLNLETLSLFSLNTPLLFSATALTETSLQGREDFTNLQEESYRSPTTLDGIKESEIQGLPVWDTEPHSYSSTSLEGILESELP